MPFDCIVLEGDMFVFVSDGIAQIGALWPRRTTLPDAIAIFIRRYVLKVDYGRGE
jgi:hypothetical protein